MPVSFTRGALIANKGWYILGGNPNFNQSQYLKTLDDTWTIGNPVLGPYTPFCSVQVIFIKFR
jgi:hypothetical protein